MLGGDNEGQTYLEYMLKAIESFYHPSNYGKWSSGLLKFMNKLATQFVKRLHRERYQEPNWEPPIPKDKKLTEEQVTRFVKSLIPVRRRFLDAPVVSVGLLPLSFSAKLERRYRCFMPSYYERRIARSGRPSLHLLETREFRLRLDAAPSQLFAAGNRHSSASRQIVRGSGDADRAAPPHRHPQLHGRRLPGDALREPALSRRPNSRSSHPANVAAWAGSQ